MKKIKIGTRDSKLAMTQTQIVADSIKKKYPDIEVVLVPMKTTGDIILDRTLDKIGGKGLFVKELDRALLNEEVDLTVHSFKDMTMEINPMIPILATGKREYPGDVLVLPKGASALNPSLPIGSSSARRNIQLRDLYPQWQIKPVRGNIITRLQKLDGGEFSALVLATAGLKRLSLDERISREFTVEEMLPANCQGVLAVQGRYDFPVEILSDFHNTESYNTSLTERAFVRELNGGCSAPIAAYAVIDELLQIHLTGLYVREEEFEEYKAKAERGEQASVNIIRGTQTGSLKDAEQIGINLAKELKNRQV